MFGLCLDCVYTMFKLCFKFFEGRAIIHYYQIEFKFSNEFCWAQMTLYFPKTLFEYSYNQYKWETMGYGVK